MKNLLKTIGIIAVIAIVGLSSMSCVTSTGIGGTGDMHGLFSGGGAKSAVTDGATEIASYSTILGLFDSGYAEYAAKVKEAEAAGKKITSVQTWQVVMFKTTAYAK